MLVYFVGPGSRMWMQTAPVGVRRSLVHLCSDVPGINDGFQVCTEGVFPWSGCRAARLMLTWLWLTAFGLKWNQRWAFHRLMKDEKIKRVLCAAVAGGAKSSCVKICESDVNHRVTQTRDHEQTARLCGNSWAQRLDVGRDVAANITETPEQTLICPDVGEQKEEEVGRLAQPTTEWRPRSSATCRHRHRERPLSESDEFKKDEESLTS